MKLLTTQEAAELIGLKVTTLEARRMSGSPPPYIKTKNRIYYSHNELCDFVDHLFSRNPKYQPENRECDRLLLSIDVNRKLKASDHPIEMMDTPDFPQPIFLGIGGVSATQRWSLHEVNAWLANHKISI